MYPKSLTRIVSASTTGFLVVVFLLATRNPAPAFAAGLQDDLFPRGYAVSGDVSPDIDYAAAPAGQPDDDGGDYRAAHKYLGYATLVMAGLAAVSSSSHGLHRAASYAAIGLGGGTIATGFKEYGGYIDLSDGLSKYDTHAILGTVGALAFTAAVIAAEADQSHSGFGVASAVSMGLSAVVIKW